jgi:hypothetical protein
MKQKFRDTKLNARSMAHLEKINEIIEDYQAQGYTLTLRQLYYQLVSRNVIANATREYKKLSRVLTEGRMAGLVDWDAIEDRLRRPQNVYTVSGVTDALEDTFKQYRRNRQQGQNTHIEVWVEKDAISSILKRVTQLYGINILVNRGYGSVTAIKDAYDRFAWRAQKGRDIVILYLGDHDPSGLDMIRDINDRVTEMLSKDGGQGRFEIKAIALTMSQIKQYNPPPNPAKITDTRSPAYIAEYGAVSWEVDALEPKVLNGLLDSEILKILDEAQYKAIRIIEESEKSEIRNFIDTYNN